VLAFWVNQWKEKSGGLLTEGGGGAAAVMASILRVLTVLWRRTPCWGKAAGLSHTSFFKQRQCREEARRAAAVVAFYRAGSITGKETRGLAMVSTQKKGAGVGDPVMWWWGSDVLQQCDGGGRHEQGSL
jgi:hypothetical protein